MGILVVSKATGITIYDNKDSAASVAANSSVVIRTITGLGFASVILKGDGGKDVGIYYKVDGGGTYLIADANQSAVISLAFTQSLVLLAINSAAVPESYCSVSSTGVLG